jgi:hypothetical protein
LDGRYGEYMIHIFYHILVFYLTVHLVWYIVREKKFWNRLGATMVLVVFILRLFLVK